MAMLTGAERTARYAEIVQYTDIELMNFTVAELRRWGKGMVPGVKSMTKLNIVKALAEVVAPERERIALKLEREKLVPVPIEVEDKRVQLRVQDNETPDKRATGLYEKIDAICSKGNEDSDLSLMKDQVADMVTQLVAWETSRYAETTIRWHRTDIKKTLLLMVEREAEPRRKSIRQEMVLYFNHRLDRGIDSIEKANKAAYQKKISAQVTNMIDIDPTEWIDKARRFLSKPETAKWAELVFALVLVTGRRPAEIHTTARFEKVSEFEVSFTGQLKTNNDEGVSYTIPTLVEADLVLAGMEVLGDLGKRIDNIHRANKLFSSGHSRAMKEIGWGQPIYEFRKLYAAVCWETIGKATNVFEPVYVGQILGHDADNRSSADSYVKYRITKKEDRSVA